MISSCDISIKALALGEAIITVRDQSGNTLDIHVIVDYYTDNYIVSKQDILLTGDLKDSEKQTFKETYKRSDAQNLKNMLDLFENFHKYIPDDKFDSIIACIKEEKEESAALS